MKTTKKIFAAVLAVMMIALMIPFSASAAEPEYTATYQLDVDATTEPAKAGKYTFSFFKIADLNLTTGQYTTTIENTELKNAVNGTNSANKSQQILTVCDKLYKADKTVFGTTAAAKISFSTDTPDKIETVKVTKPGLYYVYCTSMPSKVTAVQSSLATLPYFNGTDYVPIDNTQHILASKVKTSSVSVDKTANKTYVGDNDKPVTYTLTASTAGSIDNKLTKYAIVDTMDDGLTFNEDSVVVKYDGTGDALVKGTDYSIVKNYEYKKDKNSEVTDTATFAVVFTPATLASEAFYNAETVVVTYQANLNEKAQLHTPMPNTDGLVYGNDSDTNYEPGGHTPNVYTYGVKVVKVDGNNTSTKLAGAKFQIFTDKACTTDTALTVDGNNVVAVTDNNGEATFVLEGTTTPFKFDAIDDNATDPTNAKITYYAKEIAAPAGYNLNSSVFEFKIDTNNAYTFVGNTIKVGEKEITAVPNYPVTVPKTGGMGTMMFYVGGAALIACAGVLLFVLKRKKAAK